jgi:hypothetical protein
MLDRANYRQERALKSQFGDTTIKDFISQLLSPGYVRSNINWIMHKNA